MAGVHSFSLMWGISWYIYYSLFICWLVIDISVSCSVTVLLGRLLAFRYTCARASLGQWFLEILVRICCLHPNLINTIDFLLIWNTNNSILKIMGFSDLFLTTVFHCLLLSQLHSFKLPIIHDPFFLINRTWI